MAPGVPLATPLWVCTAPDANTFTLCTRRGGRPITIGGAGTGTHTLTKANSEAAIMEYLRRNNPAVVAAATDADNL